MTRIATSINRILGSPPVATLATAVFDDPLRVLAYHGVRDAESFRQQLGWIVDRFHVVSEETVLQWFAGTGELPARALWITFDDGDTSVIDVGQPILDELDLEASLFVCPGLADNPQPYWWDVISTARTVTGGTAVLTSAALKLVPDADRRHAVEQAQAICDDAGVPVEVRHADLRHLRAWVAAGHRLGGHSWDHPCLDQCSPDEQRAQIEDSQRWLGDHFPGHGESFAYPNGNWTPDAELALEEVGIALGVLFDHRSVTDRDQPRRVSRLRIDAHAPLHRARSIVSGGHSRAFQVGSSKRSAR